MFGLMKTMSQNTKVSLSYYHCYLDKTVLEDEF